ncbi:DEAD/DEAH box helicase [Azorhizobium doebereinerae]|uniref:DEAD/DEAH box helicase n=1 Tax=Azorhizobium doebereinerae TaxID=281091 RepID=UPI000A064E14|nr:DEAD/DEAH box helicase [Azorhizobium doebereinerae]
MPFDTSSPALARALAGHAYAEPTPVQSAVIADEATGRDLLVSAQTGSGKTVAYGLAIGETLLGTDERLPPAGAPLALVIAPTRELALQVHRELEWLYAEAGGRVISCVGGMDPQREKRQLMDGAHVVVGTPGRLRDHLERGRLDMSGLAAVVLDEADEMLDLGFREDLEFILDATPEERQTLLFSATMPRDIAALARRYQRDALRIEVAGRTAGHADIEYRAVRVSPREIEHAVVNLLRFFEAPGAIVFCNTRESVRHLTATLQERGFAAVALSGELGQNERNLALQALRDGRARVCVATDVAARGIDLPGLGLVIHAELPHDAESLQHRSGRTGRAGRKGVSVLLVPPARRRKAESLMAEARVVPSWSGPPTAEEVRDLDQERMLSDPLLAEPSAPEDATLAEALLAQYAPQELAAALVRLYRARLPAPEEVSDPGEGRGRRELPVRTGAPSGGAGGAWFRIPVGRRKNADPKWLLPLICRRGGLTKADIGAIRIFDNETMFEVAEPLAEAFLVSARASAAGDYPIEPHDGSQPERRPPVRGAYGAGAGAGPGGRGKGGPGKPKGAKSYGGANNGQAPQPSVRGWTPLSPSAPAAPRGAKGKVRPRG